MRTPSLMLEQVIGLPVIVGLFVASLATGSLESARVMLIALLVANALGCRREPRRHVLFLVFNVTFCIFLAGRSIVELLIPDIDFGVTRVRFQ